MADNKKVEEIDSLVDELKNLKDCTYKERLEYLKKQDIFFKKEKRIMEQRLEILHIVLNLTSLDILRCEEKIKDGMGDTKIISDNTDIEK